MWESTAELHGAFPDNITIKVTLVYYKNQLFH